MNDGIVTSACQMAHPNRPDEFGGLVTADHGDVRYNKRDVQRLLRNDGIVRNRLKIAATIENAKAFLAVKEEFGTFDAYSWDSSAASRSRIGGAPWRTCLHGPRNPTR